MRRVWLILLLLVNLLLFALIRWGDSLLVPPQPLLTQTEFNPEKIQLLDAAAVRALAETVPVRVPAPTPPNPVSAIVATQPASRLSPELTAVTDSDRCFSWGEFSGHDLARATAALETPQLGDRLRQRTVEYGRGYWVYMPPQKDAQQVKRKVGQLKQLGVNDYFVVQEKGEWLHAISLGVFRTEQAASNFLEVLKAKGVRTAKVGERLSKLKFTVFELRGIDAATEAKLRQIQPDFPDSELKSADCN